MRFWKQVEKANRVVDLALGAGGGSKKKGEHSLKRQHLGLGHRAVKQKTKNRKSALWTLFLKVENQFLKWRSAGQYVDKEDLMTEFDYVLGQKIQELETERNLTGSLGEQKAKVLQYAIRRRESHKKSPKARDATIVQMQKLFRCRLLKPQRLIHLSLEQECKRLCESWQFWDHTMWLACFADEKELGTHVVDAGTFREHVKKTVIAMSDQMPFWIKLTPGKQLYAPGEFAVSKTQLTGDESTHAMGQRGGGGSQSAAHQISDVIDNQGMTQTRGSNNSEQDKFRITVDVEQVCYGFFDSEVTPHADNGITSVVFTGAHFRLANADKDRCWIEDDVYYVDGIKKVCTAGERIPGCLGKALLDFRDKCPELLDDMLKINFRFYQQPAGFEDSVITKWKIREQHKIHGQVLALRDLFGGALSETSRDTMFLHQQLCSWIRSKITAICQVADTHVIRPIKIRKLQADIELRRELMKLAKLEDTPAVFKCGMYEVMRTLYRVISELRDEWLPDQYLLKAMYANGWLSMRPNLSTKKLERTCDQPWTKGFKFGSHRLQTSWCAMRYDHLDEKGVPRTTTIELDHTGETDCTDQSYSRVPGEKRDLKCWTEMYEKGEIDAEQLKEMRDEPWFEHEVANFIGFEGLQDYAELLKTPRQRRKDKGIDEYLTSQRNDVTRQQAKKRNRQLNKEVRKPLREEQMVAMRKLVNDGHSLEQVSHICIQPKVGKAAKKNMREGLFKKLKEKKLKEKKQSKESGAADEGKKVACQKYMDLHTNMYILLFHTNSFQFRENHGLAKQDYEFTKQNHGIV
jgi:hypothetical protein